MRTSAQCLSPELADAPHCARQTRSLGVILLLGMLTGCGGSSPTTPSGPPSGQPTPNTPAAPQVPNLAGTWRGSYFIVGDLSGNDGVMTWVVQQTGTTLTGTFTIQRDLLFGNVSGTINGSSTAAAGSTPNGYAVTLSSSSVSLFPGCTMVLTAREASLPTTPTRLRGTYKQTLCGFTSNLENGHYDLIKQ